MIAIVVPPGVRSAIYAHARAAFPEECCGYLVGPRDGDAVDAQIACANAQRSGDHPTAAGRGADSAFVIAGTDLFGFARSLGGPRPARIVYHSHPNGRAYFSAVDREVAAAGGYPVQHLVVGITAAGVTAVAQFALADDGSVVELARWTP